MAQSIRKFSNLVGQFLISEADQSDPNFHSTIVLIISHDSTGAFGLVLNKQSNITLGEVFPDRFENHSASCIPIFIGGPVQQEYLFLLQQHISPNSNYKEQPLIAESVYFVPNIGPILEDLYYLENSKNKRTEIRFFAGYSGWGPGQLEFEIAENFWIVHPASSDIVFHPKPEDGWREILRKKGGVYWVMAETGSKPSMN